MNQFGDSHGGRSITRSVPVVMTALVVVAGCSGTRHAGTKPDQAPVEIVVSAPAGAQEVRQPAEAGPVLSAATEQPIPTPEDFGAEALKSLESSDIEGELDKLESEIEE